MVGTGGTLATRPTIPAGGMKAQQRGVLSEPSRWAAWTAPDRSTGEGESIGSVSLISPATFRRIGHSLFCLILAFAGGVLARHLDSTRDEAETQEAR